MPVFTANYSKAYPQTSWRDMLQWDLPKEVRDVYQEGEFNTMRGDIVTECTCQLEWSCRFTILQYKLQSLQWSILYDFDAKINKHSEILVATYMYMYL